MVYYIVFGNLVKVGDKIEIFIVGIVEVMLNSVFDFKVDDLDVFLGVVLFLERIIFIKDNMNNYDF